MVWMYVYHSRHIKRRRESISRFRINERLTMLHLHACMHRLLKGHSLDLLFDTAAPYSWGCDALEIAVEGTRHDYALCEQESLYTHGIAIRFARSMVMELACILSRFSQGCTYKKHHFVFLRDTLTSRSPLHSTQRPRSRSRSGGFTPRLWAGAMSSTSCPREGQGCDGGGIAYFY